MKYVTTFFVKTYQVVSFVIYYLTEMIKANILIATDILSPRPKMTPGLLKVKLEVESDHEILSLFNLISMTPGTLSIDLSDDKKFIYIHAWHVKDVDAFKENLKNTLEKRVLEVYR